MLRRCAEYEAGIAPRFLVGNPGAAINNVHGIPKPYLAPFGSYFLLFQGFGWYQGFGWIWIWMDLDLDGFLWIWMDGFGWIWMDLHPHSEILCGAALPGAFFSRKTRPWSKIRQIHQNPFSIHPNPCKSRVPGKVITFPRPPERRQGQIPTASS